eukprot:GEMP01098577.1.p1 GENE.GEMP01098577.1~~GEMP01098577.1.p1  ORF type:complete len:260 (+),score=43.64 GEMP01098577.1:42-821(+)
MFHVDQIEDTAQTASVSSIALSIPLQDKNNARPIAIPVGCGQPQAITVRELLFSRPATGSYNATSPLATTVAQATSLGALAASSDRLAKNLDKLDWKDCEILIVNCGNSKFFDGDLFEALTARFLKELKGGLRPSRAIVAFQVLHDLNALNARARVDIEEFFRRQKSDLDNGILASLKQVFGNEFTPSASASSSGPPKAVCPAFWRGQCKWGSRCKQSHSEDQFESTMQSGRWKKPKGESVGMQQSMSLSSADKTGALW